MGKLNSIQDFKCFVGEVIYAMPTGNAARGWGGDLYSFEVVSVARKYVDLRSSSFGSVDSYLPESGATKKAILSGYSNNSGYLFFDSKASYLKFKEHSNLASELSKKLRHFNYGLLSMSDLKSIESILKPF